MEGEWRTSNITTLIGCGLWRSIIKEWEDFCGHISIKAGAGKMISSFGT